MHKSYLEFGYHVEDLLFKGVTVDSVGGMVGLCFSVAFFTFSYEGIRTLRQRVASSMKKQSADQRVHPKSVSDNQSERDMLVEMGPTQSISWMRIKAHIVQAILYMMQVTMSYVLMLVIMSYNAWLAITVFASAGLSYYFFGMFVLYRPSVIPIEILAPQEFSQ